MDKDFWCDFVAGWIGGCAGLLAGHPMDTIKVRQQLYGKLTISNCLKKTYKYEGFRGFYKGLGFPLLATGTLNSLFFGVYGNCLRQTAGGEQKENTPYKYVFWAACAGGVVQLAVACPVDLVKIKMQSQMGSGQKSWSGTTTNYKGPTDCLLDLYKKGKVKGCYRGMASMAVRDVPSFGLYMVIYEGFIRSLAGNQDNASKPTLVFCGGMAGALSWMTIVPLDVIKSRIQADDPVNPKYKGMIDCLKQSYKNEGISIFTRGFVMVTLRALPTNGAIFLGYVMAMNFFKDQSDST